MKKTIITIGKGLLGAALFLAGILAFCYMVGEPTDEWYEWAGKTFGAFAGVWFILEKVISGLVIYACCKVWMLVEPNAFKSGADISTKAVEE